MSDQAADSALFQFSFGSSVGVALLATIFAPPPVALETMALAAIVGGLIGAASWFVHRLLGLLAAPMASSIWVVLGLLLGGAVAHGLGAFGKFSGPHSSLALATATTNLAGGAAGGWLFSLYAPTKRGRLALHIPNSLVKKLLPVVFFALAIVLVTFDSTMGWLKSYPLARRAIVLTAWLMASLAVIPFASGWSLRGRFFAAMIWLPLVILGTVRALGLPPDRLGMITSDEHSLHVTKALRWLTDWDRDGSSSLLGGGDCAPFNPKIHPRAKEIPGNGIDDNCRYGDAPLEPEASISAIVSSKSPPPLSVVLVSIDTLRADRTTPYGHDRDTTPHLQRFAARARRFSNALSPGAWTCLALPSLFSGVYARRLEWEPVAQVKDPHDNRKLVPLPWRDHVGPEDAYATMFTLPATKKYWNFVHALRGRGMHTAAAVASWPAHIPIYLDLGFDHMEAAGSSDRDVTDRALEMLGAFDQRQFFLWVHYFNPHDPHVSREGVPSYGDSLLDRYDHEVASTDLELGRLLDAIDALKRDVAVIVTSDHGEVLEDPYAYHGTDLLEDTLRIPLLLRAPGVVPGVTTTPASLVDIAPTVLALTETQIPSGLDGVDLRTLEGDRVVIADLWRVDETGSVYLDQTSVTNLEHHLMWDRMLNVEILTRAGDLSRPPRPLSLAEVPPIAREALGRYLERAKGGPE